MKPGIHERIYEFCFNTEFCQRFSALLATYPLIPSQRIEHDLGYDVEFKIKEENYTTSVFLQHKVPHFVQHRKGRNARFYDSHDGAYYRFSLSNDQHNVLRKLAQKHAGVYYCAPLFYTRDKLTQYVTTSTIYTNSVWLPLRSTNLVGSGTHNLTYSVDGSLAHIHSETDQVSIIKLTDFENLKNLPVPRESYLAQAYSENTLNEMGSLADELMELTFPNSEAVSGQMNRHYEIVDRLEKSTEKIQYILGNIYDVSWLLLRS